MHNPPCETWDVHLRRCFVERGTEFVSLERFCQDVIESWADEQLVNDPDFGAWLDEVRKDAAREEDVWERLERYVASPRTDL